MSQFQGLLEDVYPPSSPKAKTIGKLYRIAILLPPKYNRLRTAFYYPGDINTIVGSAIANLLDLDNRLASEVIKFRLRDVAFRHYEKLDFEVPAGEIKKSLSVYANFIKIGDPHLVPNYVKVAPPPPYQYPSSPRQIELTPDGVGFCYP